MITFSSKEPWTSMLEVIYMEYLIILFLIVYVISKDDHDDDNKKLLIIYMLCPSFL